MSCEAYEREIAGLRVEIGVLKRLLVKARGARIRATDPNCWEARQWEEIARAENASKWDLMAVALQMNALVRRWVEWELLFVSSDTSRIDPAAMEALKALQDEREWLLEKCAAGVLP